MLFLRPSPSSSGSKVVEVTNGAGLKRTRDPVHENVSAEVPEQPALSQNDPNPFNVVKGAKAGRVPGAGPSVQV